MARADTEWYMLRGGIYPALNSFVAAMFFRIVNNAFSNTSCLIAFRTAITLCRHRRARQAHAGALLGSRAATPASLVVLARLDLLDELVLAALGHRAALAPLVGDLGVRAQPRHRR